MTTTENGAVRLIRVLVTSSLLFLVHFFTGASGAEGLIPKVVRVRAPEGQVSNYFSPGTALRSLDPDKFEALMAAASLAAPRSEQRPGPTNPRRPFRPVGRGGTGWAVGHRTARN